MKCKNCNCNCHCSLKEHSDLYGVCSCNNCDCKEECEVCQQTKQNVVICIPKKKKNPVHVAKPKKTKNKQRSKMNKLFLVLALLFALSACSVGKKCTYTQEGTKISSWIWFYGSDKPIDLDKNNCTQEFMEIDEVFIYIFNTDTIGVFNSLCRFNPV